MRKFLIAVLSLALLVPAAALAGGKPANPGSQGQGGAAKVMYVLHGTLTAYTPASGATNGSVTISVTGANHHAASMKGHSFTFAVSSATKVVGTYTANDNGIVKLRGAKSGLGDPATFASLVAKQVIDQGTSTETD